MTKSKLFSSFIIAIIATILFTLIHNYFNVKLTKQLTEDKAFDFLAKYYLADENVKTKSPHVMVFGIDNFYFKSENMIDEDNNTNYGFLFPHDKIAKFIAKIDKLPKDKHPKALFIDYDFEFTSTVYGAKLSKENLVLIESLKQQRNYTILLPKTSKYNFIESCSDKTIQSLISRKKIVFVSVALPYSKDSVTRRFTPYMTYRHSVTNQEYNYTSAYVKMWQMFNLDSNISKDFKEQDVVENKLIVKNYKEPQYKEPQYINSTYKQSNWEMLDYYSANYPLDRINNDNFTYALLLLGRTDGEESFKVISEKGQLSGVEVQANALMTLFYFDGRLKKVDIYKSLPFVFILFFLSSLFIHKFLNLLPNKIRIFLVKREISQITVSFALATVVMALVSVFTLVGYQKWLDWNSSLILFGASSMLLGVIEIIVRLKINLRSIWMKIGIVLVIMAVVGMLFANSLVVTDGNVRVTVDSKEYNLTKDDNQTLKAGEKVCVKEGNGTVLINNQVQLSSDSNNSCLELAKKKKFDFKLWLRQNLDKVALLFSESKEQVKLAVTRKGGEAETAKGVMVLKASDEYLVIKNSTWSPLPITLKVLDSKGVEVDTKPIMLKILDSKGVEVDTDINENDDETFFIISHEVLKSGYRVLVSDGFDSIVVDIEIMR